MGLELLHLFTAQADEPITRLNRKTVRAPDLRFRGGGFG